MMKKLTNEPALLLDGALVVGDLHIGLEQQLSRKGVHLPSPLPKMLDRVNALLDSTGAPRLIILGDLKHNIASISGQERKEIPLFMKALGGRVDMTVVLGNHDGGLKPLLQGYDVHDAQGFLYKKTLLFHGNAKPRTRDLEGAKRLVASHWHPIHEFKDPLGGRLTEKVWVEAHAFGKPLLIMPSFNRLLGGIPIKKITDKWVDLHNAKVYLLDGLYMGEYNG